MKSVLFFLIFSLGASFHIIAQKQNNVWYFGDNAGLDFNSGVPVALLNGMMVTTEGCASMADANGNIIMYTEGVNVFGSNHLTMPNGTGLFGGISSSQSAFILPLPGSNTLYYIFTVEQQGSMGRFCYSIVDMTFNGGLGDVTIKNTVIHSPVTEKLVGTRHNNGTDYWVLVHELNSDAFYAYQLTAAGLNMTPVISHTGMTHNDGIGCMKISHNSKWAAININSTSEIELFDFNNSTGVVSNPLTFPTIYLQPYGMEFSADNSKLYVAEAGNQGGPVDIFQFDLTGGSPAAILASAVSVGSSSNPYLGPLQIGPDCKIYAARYNSGYIAVINDPNASGPACNFVDAAVYLGGVTCRYGLPNQLSSCSQSYFIDGTCAGDSTHFNIMNTSGLLAVQWDFGDPASGVNNVSFLNNPVHYFNTAGTYQVTTLIYYSSFTDTVIVPVTIYPLPVVNLGPDTSFCAGTPFTMYAGSYTSYLWSDNSTDSVLTVTLPGTYWVTVQEDGCSGADTVSLASAPCNVPVVNLMSSDTVFCDKNCIDFTDLSTNSPTSWQWFFPGADSTFSTGQNPSGICYNSFGSFDVTLIACNAAGCDTLFLPDFIVEYQVPPTPVITQSNDTLYSSPAFFYAWYSTANPGNVISNNSYITTSNGGSYFVVISDSVGCQSSSTIFVAAGIMETSTSVMNVSWDPVSGMVQVNLTGLKGGSSVDIKVTNLLGQEVYKTTTGERSTMIDLNSSSGGIYFIRVISTQGVYTKEIILEN